MERGVDERDESKSETRKRLVHLQDHFDLNLTDTQLNPMESMKAHFFWSQNTSTWIQLENTTSSPGTES